MKKMLLATVAAAAVAGLTSVAVAQAPGGGESGKATAKPAGAAQEEKAPAGGAMMHQPVGGAQSTEKKEIAPSGQSAQGAKPEQHMGQQTGHEERGVEQKGATEEHGTRQKGAEEERATEQKGAQEESGSAREKGAHAETRMDSTKSSASESNKSNVNASETTGKGSRSGDNVKLSETQRTKIQSIIGKSSTARVSTDVHFNIAVGVAVPRSVHVAVLPEDVVEVVPQYEGFDYVVVGDQILIIDPDSMEIVAIIPA